MMKLAEVVSLFVGPDADVAFTAYDGSRYGRQDSDVRIDVRSPSAVSMLMSAPGQLGLARAYVSGELEVYGDLYTGSASTARPSPTRHASTGRWHRSRCAGFRPRRRRCVSGVWSTRSVATTTPSPTTTT
jgi:hypothetical protein